MVPSPGAVLVDDADLVAGAFPDRLRSMAESGVLVVLTLPRHLIVQGAGGERSLEPEWARIADVVVEARQATWPDDEGSLRPGLADLIVLKNRWGPTRTVSVGFQGHYARFVDITTT